MLTDALYSEAMAFLQVVFIDLVLAGDNAIVVGMAAAGVDPEQRRKVIVGGIGAAVVLRIIFAAATMELLDVIGLLFAGGILLLWVCWKLWRELREQKEEAMAAAMLEAVDEDEGAARPCGGPAPATRARKTVRQAIWQVAVADVSMSLDNVLAVAGAADDHMSALVFGLALSVVLMGAGAALIARFMQRWHWLGYVGLALIAYVAATMIFKGGMEIYTFAGL